MAGLYVPLDVEYASDDKLIEAGALAELLYVRGLCFAKRTMSDGVIKRSQLTAVGLGIPSAAKHAQRLVDVGAWAASKNGWTINAWLKRNKSAADIRADHEAKKANSALANHRRWHVGEGKDPSVSCIHCFPSPDPKTDPKTDPPENSVGSPKEEGREGTTEGEGKPQEKGEESQSSSSAVKLSIVPNTTDGRTDDDYQHVIELVVDAKQLEWAGRIDKPRGWRHKVYTNTHLEDGAVIRSMLADGAAVEAVAAFVLGHGISTEPDRNDTPWCPDTCQCEGDGWIWTPKGLAPCPGRTA